MNARDQKRIEEIESCNANLGWQHEEDIAWLISKLREVDKSADALSELLKECRNKEPRGSEFAVRINKALTP